MPALPTGGASVCKVKEELHFLWSFSSRLGSCISLIFGGPSYGGTEYGVLRTPYCITYLMPCNLRLAGFIYRFTQRHNPAPLPHHVHINHPHHATMPCHAYCPLPTAHCLPTAPHAFLPSRPHLTFLLLPTLPSFAAGWKASPKDTPPKLASWLPTTCVTFLASSTEAHKPKDPLDAFGFDWPA